MDPKTPYAYGLCLILSSHRFPWRHTFHMLGIPSRKSVAFPHSLIFTNSSWVVYTSIILHQFLPDWPFKTTHETWPGIHGFLFVFKFRGGRVPGITLLENDPALQLHVTLTEPQKNMQHKSVLGCFWDQVVWDFAGMDLVRPRIHCWDWSLSCLTALQNTSFMDPSACAHLVVSPKGNGFCSFRYPLHNKNLSWKEL